MFSDAPQESTDHVICPMAIYKILKKLDWEMIFRDNSFYSKCFVFVVFLDRHVRWSFITPARNHIDISVNQHMIVASWNDIATS